MTDNPDHNTLSALSGVAPPDGDNRRDGLVGTDRGDLAESEDGLADLILDLESRLERIRETHLEQGMLEVDVLTREGELVVYRDELADRERLLGNNDVLLRDQEQLIERERSQFDEQRGRINDHLSELAEIESALVERARDQAMETGELDHERAMIESKRLEIESEQKQLSERESHVIAKAEKVAQERERIVEAYDALITDKRILEDQAAEQDFQAKQLDEMRTDLAAREKELESRFTERDELKDMLSEMSSQLEASRVQARSQAERYEKAIQDKAADIQRSEDLERRCATLEGERARIRGELSKLRRSSASPDTLFNPRAPEPREIDARRAPNQTGKVGGLIWLVSSCIAAIGIAVSLGEQNITMGLMSLGAGAALCIFACYALIARAFDSSMLLIAGLVGTLGLWFPHWLQTVTKATSLWELPPEILPASMVDRIPLAFSGATATLAAAICLYLLTNAAEVLGQTLFAALVVTGILMIPTQSVELQATAAGVWMAIVAASIVKWAVRTADQAAGKLD